MRQALICFLLLIISIPLVALTEQEEFELYKEFKLSKKNNETPVESSNNSVDTESDSVNVIINNNFPNEQSTNNNQSTINAYHFYNKSKKEPLLGSLFAYLIPTSGHFYAEDWGRGVPFLIAEVVGLSMMISSSTTECNSDYYYDSCSDSVTEYETYLMGAAILVVAKVWEIIDAHNAVTDRNNQLKRAINLHVGLDHYDQFTAGLQYNF